MADMAAGDELRSGTLSIRSTHITAFLFSIPAPE